MASRGRTEVRTAGLALVALILLLPGTGRAVPLYFTGINTGFEAAALAAAGLSPLFVAPPPPVTLWLGAGDPSAGVAVSVVEIARTTVRNPQADMPPTTPSLADPALVDVTIRITNTSGGPLTTPLLVFTGANPNTGIGDPPVTALGLEADLLDSSLRFNPSSGAPFFYGALSLPDLATDGPEASVERSIRYVVAGTMRIVENTGQCESIFTDCVLVPPYGLAVIDNPTVIPEPSTLLMLGAGLLLLGRPRSA